MADRKVYLAARVRPLTPREVSMGAKRCVVVDGNCTTIVNPDTGDAKAFVLDYSFDSSDPADRSGWQANNETIFQEVGAQVIKNALEGYKTCVFAHGHVASGKTYSLVGQESDPGLLPRVLEALFQQEAVIARKLAVTASFYEIKDEQVRDILKQDFYTPGGLKVRTLPNGSGSVIVQIEGLSAVPLREMVDCEELLAQILKYLGAIEPSTHTVFSLELFTAGNASDTNGSKEMEPYSSIRIVDLAGASHGGDSKVNLLGGKKSGPTPDKSLLAWANVMAALAEQQIQQKDRKAGKVFVPFRGSMLTRVLEDSLTNRSRCYIIANLSPSHLAYRETLNTFRDIVRTKEVKKVARNEAILNQYLGDTDFIPAAGGGWRWSYCSKLPEQPPAS